MLGPYASWNKETGYAIWDNPTAEHEGIFERINYSPKGIIHCGIERVVSPAFEYEFTQKRWEKSCSTTFDMFEQAGIQYDLIKGFTN